MTTPLTPKALRASLHGHPAACYWIAYSGGVDSHVLLHLCARLRELENSPPQFRAIHIHHGLQSHADAWSAHCESVCRELGLAFLTVHVDARAQPGESPEAAARQARYTAIAAQMQPGDIALTAQHRDDQAETLLLQLLRGAGLAGLAAMPGFSPLGAGFLLRPLLEFSRAELLNYALEQGLRWIDDPSNQDIAFDRNFLRHEIIPKLTQRWPAASLAIARSAGHCAQAQLVLDERAGELLNSAFNEDGLSLSVELVKDFKLADQKLALRAWIRRRGFRIPSQVVIERILHEVLPASPDKNPQVVWGGGEIRRYRDGLFVIPHLPRIDATAKLDWDGNSPLVLPDNNGRLIPIPDAQSGIAAEYWATGVVINVGFRQGGEVCRLPGRSGRHDLKKLFQEKGIVPWLRDRAPLVYIGGELAAVGGWWVCEPFAGQEGANNIALVWEHPAMHASQSAKAEKTTPE